MSLKMHNVGLVLVAEIIAALAVSVVLRAVRPTYAPFARLVANLVADIAVAIFTGREALQAFERGGDFYIAIGAVLTV